MKAKVTMLMILCMGFWTTMSAQLIKKVEGDGNYIDKEIEVGIFDEIVINSAFHVYYTQDASSKGTAKITAEKNIMDMVEVELKKNKVVLSMKKSLNVTYNLVTIYLTSPTLHEVKNGGSGIFEAKGLVKTDKFNCSVSGNDGQLKFENLQSEWLKASVVSSSGDILLKGQTKEAGYTVTGGGEIRADGMEAETVSCSVNGSGNIGCHAVKLLKSTLIGVGSVYYKGSPEIKSTNIGKGRVTPMAGQ